MHGKSSWQGKEVEGRFSDIMTLFIRDGGLPFGWGKYPHIYFTIEYIRKSIHNNKWNDILDILDNSNIMVTIEADADTFDNIPVFLFNRIHVIYRISVPNDHMNKLKKFDTISLDSGWYRCLQATKHIFLETEPDSYKWDQEIK